MTTDDFQFGDTYEKPLIPPDFGGTPEDVVYDETGDLGSVRIAASPAPLIGGRAPVTVGVHVPRPCGLGVLDGSWNINVRPRLGFLAGSLRGPMRIEASDGVLRVSGDAYFQKPTFAPVGVLDRSPFKSAGFIRHWNWNWYPHYPFKEYVWYFRSTGASYTNGELFFPFVRHLWNKSTQEFVSTDKGWMRFPCSSSVFTSRWFPQPTMRMNGQAMIGGQLHNITATKTSPYYRGCVVEVDLMANRNWPGNPGGQSFNGTFRGDGLDVRMYINQTNVPEDNSLTDAEYNTLMSTHRSISSIGNTWRIWTLVGSKRAGSNTFGLIFDTSGTVQREGCVSYTDATFGNSTDLEPSIRGDRLGDVPLGHLRTLVHEVGHCLNLFHPKSDDHNPDIGKTIMNQTGDVMDFATAGNLYPNNAEFGFNDHNRDSLIHAPDPQIAPGWKPFGWGHTMPDVGVPVPTDVVGLSDAGSLGEDLSLSLDLPDSASVGEFITAKVSLSNDSPNPAQVNSSLNLADGNLSFEMRTPAGNDLVVRDVVLLCGEDSTTGLKGGGSIDGVVQLFYTNCGHTFASPGTYEVRAVYSHAPGSRDRVVSATHQLSVDAPASSDGRKLAELSMDDAVGLSFAFGDFGSVEHAAAKLKALSVDFADTDTGTAAALVLANSYARPFRDLREGVVARKSNGREVSTAIGRAMGDTRSDRVAKIAITIASASDTEAPLLERIRDHIDSNKKTKGGKAASQRALDILEDYAQDS